jgi:hypothetical protein
MVVIITLFLTGFMILFSYLLLSNYLAVFQTMGMYTGDLERVGNNFLNAFFIIDKLMSLIMVVLIIAIGVTSYRIAAPPFFFILMFIIGIFYGFIAYFFNYIFQEIAAQSVFSAIVGLFPITMFICRNLQWVMLIEIIIASITLYAKKPQGQNLQENVLSGKFQ